MKSLLLRYLLLFAILRILQASHIAFFLFNTNYATFFLFFFDKIDSYSLIFTL